MNSREKTRATLNHEKTDCFPIDLGSIATTFELDAYFDLLEYLEPEDCRVKIFRSDHVDLNPCEYLLERFHVDTRYVHFKRPQDPLEGNTFVDEWGITWTKTGFYFDAKKPTFDAPDLHLLEEFDWPHDMCRDNVDYWTDRAKDLYENTDKAVVANAIGLGIFEQATWMRGIEEFYKDLYINERFAEKLLEKVLETHMEVFDRFLGAVGKYVDAVWVLDDLGHQEGLIVSPEKYRRLIKPRQKRLFDFIKERVDASLILHSDGAIRPVIEDLIDIGVDALNPVQFTAKGMDIRELKREYGNRLVFWGGGCDTQGTLPFGGEQEIRKEVREQVKMLNDGGGFVFAPVHNVQPNTPAANVVAMMEEAVKCSEEGSGMEI